MIRLPRRPVRYLSLLALATGALLVPAAPAFREIRQISPEDDHRGGRLGH